MRATLAAFSLFAVLAMAAPNSEPEPASTDTLGTQACLPASCVASGVCAPSRSVETAPRGSADEAVFKVLLRKLPLLVCKYLSRPFLRRLRNARLYGADMFTSTAPMPHRLPVLSLGLPRGVGMNSSQAAVLPRAFPMYLPGKLFIVKQISL